MAPGTPVVGAPDASLSSSRLLPTFSRPAGFWNVASWNCPTFCSWIRSEEHTSELQSLMRSSYAVFCLKKKKPNSNKICQTHLSTKRYTANINDIRRAKSQYQDNKQQIN